MDEAAIFAVILRRNALRRADDPPTIDVRAEFVRQVALPASRIIARDARSTPPSARSFASKFSRSFAPSMS
jgi:hypothetical protein